MAVELARAYERMLAVAVAALRERDPGQLWPLVAEALPSLCGGDALICKLGEWNDTGGTIGLSPEAEAHWAPIDDEAGLRRGYPFADHFMAGSTRRPVTARRTAGDGWAASRTAHMIGRIMNADHALGIPLPGETLPITGCLVYRAGPISPRTMSRSPNSYSPCWPEWNSSGSSWSAGAPRRHRPTRLPRPTRWRRTTG
jgi:hypothetical protein